MIQKTKKAIDKQKNIWYNSSISQKTIQNYLKKKGQKKKWLFSIIATQTRRKRSPF